MPNRFLSKGFMLCLCLLGLAGCSLEPKKELPVPIDRKLTPLRMVCSEYANDVVLTKGQAYSQSPDSPIRITIMEINGQEQSCLIQSKDIQTGETLSGWVRVGENATFAPQHLGTQGLGLQSIAGDKATIVVRWGEVTRVE